MGFVLPTHDFSTKSIKAWKDKPVDSKKARELVTRARQLVIQARRRRPGDHPPPVYYYLAFQAYHEALEYDPGNWAIYFNCGVLLHYNKKPEAATSYLMQAIDIAPWGSPDDRVFRQLGLSLKEQGKRDEEALVLQDGSQSLPALGLVLGTLRTKSPGSQRICGRRHCCRHRPAAATGKRQPRSSPVIAREMRFSSASSGY